MKRRLLIALPVFVASALLFSGCGLGNIVTPPVVAGIYATTADAAGAPSEVAVPAWVPADASMIRIKTDKAKGASILTFTVPQPAAPEGSDPATTPAPPVTPIGDPCSAEMSAKLPLLEDSWWPQLIPAEGVTCSGNWHIFIAGTQFYAWSP